MPEKDSNYSFYFRFYRGGSAEDADLLARFLRSFRAADSDQMRYVPSDEAEAEMEEWDKILHPEKYKSDKEDNGNEPA